MDKIPKYELKDKPADGIPLSVNNWLPYWQLEMEYDPSILTGHLDSNRRIADGLEKIVSTATDFDSLKSELLKFIQDRRDFINDAEQKWDSPDYKRWGFPR